jgi:hypothetical protein
MKLTDPPLWIAIPLCAVFGICFVASIIILKIITQ